MAIPSVYVNDRDLSAMGFDVESVKGPWDGLSVTQSGTVIPGRAGQLGPVTDPGSATRTIELAGKLRGTSNGDVVTKWLALKSLFGTGVLEIRRVDEPTRVHFGRLVSLTPTPIAAALIATAYEVSATLLCDDPYAYDLVPRVVSFAQLATPIALGTAPSLGMIRLLPTDASANAVNPVVSYRDCTGAVRESIGFTRTIAAADFLEIDLSLFSVTRSVAGVRTNDLAAQSAGQFFALSPLDGRYADSVWPTLEVSAGRGEILYRRAWA